MQRAIDAVADADLVVLRLDVHVGGAISKGLSNDRVDDPYDRSIRAEVNRLRVDRDPPLGG